MSPPLVRIMLRSFRLRRLAWLVVPYAAWLWWLHALVRNPLNVDYLQRYVSLRCSDAQMARRDASASREQAVELEAALRRCEALVVAVDGVWGGIDTRPSVRLAVHAGDGAPAEMKYYSVDVNPILGVVAVRFEITPALYYWNP
jgi:hypothetical protein